eukprot:3863700-Heterocapsa_arctica.AAC.1
MEAHAVSNCLPVTNIARQPVRLGSFSPSSQSMHMELCIAFCRKFQFSGFLWLKLRALSA